MEYNKFITRDPDIMLGKPIIKGTRITVELIMRKLGNGYSIDELLTESHVINCVKSCFQNPVNQFVTINKSKIRIRKI